MEIRYLGHSAFLIEAKTSAGRVKIVTDPFDPKMVGLSWKKELTADLLLISHGHSDHNFAAGLKSSLYTISGPGEYEVKGVKVLGVPSFHDEELGQKRGKNTIYVVEAEGLFICHLGDLGQVLTEEQISQIGRVDILMVPVGGFFTIDAEQAMKVTTQLEPLIVIPMHYKAPGLAEKFEVLSSVSSYLKELGKQESHEEVLKVDKNSLPQEEMKVVVLERS